MFHITESGDIYLAKSFWVGRTDPGGSGPLGLIDEFAYMRGEIYDWLDTNPSPTPYDQLTVQD